MSNEPAQNDQLDPRLKEEYWEVVVDCLTRFHQFSAADARARSEKLRASIEAPPEGISSEIFYHAEPFDVACDLAKRRLDPSRYRAEYDQILRQHAWVMDSSTLSGAQIMVR
jgi:hypothetical protein